MELRQLEYLVAVAEEASFTRAAQRVHISQSGVSAQVRQLEHELGAELFDRSARTATLTQAGEAALAHARAALASAAAMRQAVDDVIGLLRGRLTVGMVTACTVTGLFDALDAFHRAHPGVTVTLTEEGSSHLVGLVRSGDIDLALIGAAGGAPDGLAALPIVSERLVAAFPASHPLSQRSCLALEDLSRLPLICMPAGTGIRAAFDQACAARGVRPTVALEASAASVVADLAARGLGVAILSESMAAALSESMAASEPMAVARAGAAGRGAPGRERLQAMPITDCDTPALLALVWKPSPAPAVAEFVRHCRHAFALGAA
jgi:DNA-binding transcriptional LysR family regulator